MTYLMFLPSALSVALGFLVAQSDPISGGAGWIGAGLLGAVLAWLTMVHLPAKDKQLKDILDRQEAERDKDRASRHEANAIFQKAMAETELQHIKDAEKDREAFLERNNRVEKAIEAQTARLELAIRSSCRFVMPPIVVTNPSKGG